MSAGHELRPTAEEAGAAVEARYYAEARVRGVTRRVAAKALDAAKAAGIENPVSAAWGALAARAQGRQA